MPRDWFLVVGGMKIYSVRNTGVRGIKVIVDGLADEPETGIVSLARGAACWQMHEDHADLHLTNPVRYSIYDGGRNPLPIGADYSPAVSAVVTFTRRAS